MTAMSGSITTEVRKRVLPTRDRFWRPEDFDGSPEAVAKSLSRLAEAGELRRVRRGLYWRGAPTPLGMAPPPAGRLVDEIIDRPGVGPAGWSAALALGLSTQVPRHEMVAIPGRVPRNPGSVKLVSRAASTKRCDERLRHAEVALLEVLRDWNELVEAPLSEAMDRISHLIHTGAIRIDRVVRAAATEPPRVRERLRSLLEALNLNVDAIPRARSESARASFALAS